MTEHTPIQPEKVELTNVREPKGRSFLGVTAHWLNKESMKRECAALACRRLTGKHDYLLLGKELCKVHDQFEITEKVIGTTTDNGSNFVKAFSVFGPSEDESEDNQGHVLYQ